MDSAKILSRYEAAEYLRISVRTLDRRQQEGRIQYISDRKHARVQYLQRDLDAYIQRCRKKGGR